MSYFEKFWTKFNFALYSQKCISFPTLISGPSSHTKIQPKCGLTSFYDQNCGIQCIDTQTYRNTGVMTDRKVTTKGPNIM